MLTCLFVKQGAIGDLLNLGVVWMAKVEIVYVYISNVFDICPNHHVQILGHYGTCPPKTDLQNPKRYTLGGSR